VLVYHSVGTTPWAVSEADFRSQIEWLRTTATIVTLDQLLAGHRTDPLQVAITFDDGYLSLHDVALPILKAAGAVATVFAVTGCVTMGWDRRASDDALGHYPREFFLSWLELRRLAEEGWSVGSHGVAHLDLTIAREETAREELASSKAAIEASLSVPCTTFSYTWGRHTAALRRLVGQTGYRYAVSSRHAPVRADDDMLAIPRINIPKEYTIDDFKSVVCGDWDYIGWTQRVRAL